MPSIKTGREPKLKQNFTIAAFKETAGAHTGLTTNKAETDAPAAYFGSVSGDYTKHFKNVKHGVIKQIRVRLNWANAVNLTSIRLYTNIATGDYESRLYELFKTDDYVAAIVDDDLYIFNVDIPFVLKTANRMYYAPTWSAASGNIQGFIEVRGIGYG